MFESNSSSSSSHVKQRIYDVVSSFEEPALELFCILNLCISMFPLLIQRLLPVQLVMVISYSFFLTI